MSRFVFDIETDNLLDKLTCMHVIVAKDLDTGKVYTGTSRDQDHMMKIVRMIEKADEISAHNLLGFDMPTLDKLYGFKPTGKLTDTLVWAKLVWFEIKDLDFRLTRAGKLPKNLIGSHSLGAYGYRLKCYKGDFGTKDNAWDVLTDDMISYCQQDVEVLEKLYIKLESKKYSKQAIDIEMKFAEIIERQVRYGILFNERKAIELMVGIREKQVIISDRLTAAFPARFIPVQNGKIFTSKVNNKKRCVTKGAKFCKIKEEVFNPNSRQQVASRFIKKYGWEPKELTPSGMPMVNETILNGLDYPEAKILAEYMMLTKRIGMIADGKQAWLKSTDSNSRIHGRVNTLGAVSGRCTHSTPNVAQVPSVNSPYGHECRELFCVPEGKKLVGCDASGLELRGFAHYLHKYDKGAYSKTILEGDIHVYNQKAAGLPTRNSAKTFIYGLLYGAGNGKLGEIINGSFVEGKRLRDKFMAMIPAYSKLAGAIEARMQEADKKNRVLKGIDGRILKPRSEHSALNLLIQSSGAVICKQALNNCDATLQEAGLIPGINYEFVINCHDEWQCECDEDKADLVAKLSIEAFQKAGKDLKFKCPVDGEAKIGNNWQETH